MKFSTSAQQPRTIKEIKDELKKEFKKPKSESQCITELKEIKQMPHESVWDFDQRFKTLLGQSKLCIPYTTTSRMVYCCVVTTYLVTSDATKGNLAD